jgi:hypothetical protein
MCECVDCRRLDKIFNSSKATKEEREQDDIRARWHSGGR